MQSRAKVLGHPIHPMLVPIPIGLFLISLIFDIIASGGGSVVLGTAAYWNILGGIVAGVLAGIIGLIDWRAIPKGTRAKRIGLLHAVGNVLVLGLFIVSWLTRLHRPHHAPTGLGLAFETIAVALLLVTGWLGGELVERLGIGVDDGANVDAPNSIRQKRA